MKTDTGVDEEAVGPVEDKPRRSFSPNALLDASSFESFELKDGGIKDGEIDRITLHQSLVR